jgi:hypothetical protein
MFGLTKLFNALNALAEGLLALAGTVAEVNAGLRQRLALDGPDAEPGGEVIEHHAGAGPAPAPRRAVRKATA